MKDFIRKNIVRIAVGSVFILILISATLSFYNRSIMSNALVLKQQSNVVLKEVDRVGENIRLMDISSRGYALIHQPEYLFWKPANAEQRTKEVFRKLDSLFALQGYEHPKYYEEVKKGLNQYTKMFARMVNHLLANENDQYVALLAKDEGRLFFQFFTPFTNEIIAFEAQINTTAQAQYEQAVFRNTIVQVLLLIIGLPTLFLIVYTLAQDDKNRIALLLDLEKNNKQYLFDNGLESEKEAKVILENSIQSLQKASNFVNQISIGDYNAKWEGLEESNQKLNNNNLAGRLMYMRDEMKKVKEEDRKNIWVTEGLSNFSQIIRQHQNDLHELTLKSLIYLIKYLQLQQGSLFILEKDEENNEYLKLAACYAFDRRKFIDKKINIGEGLVGQIFLEAQIAVLKKIPDGYMTITSGLGDAAPKYLAIVPLKYNDKVLAVLEVAGFKDYESYQISFLEKAGEFIASAIASAQNNERNKVMMDQMRIQTEQLRNQEEELRQNLEELEATQEDMSRKGNV